MGLDYPKPREETRLSPWSRNTIGRLGEEAERLRTTTGRSRKITEDYGKKPEDYGRLREEAGRLRKTTGRSRKTTEDYGKKPEDYVKTTERSRKTTEDYGDPANQRSRHPGKGGEGWGGGTRDPEIQKSRNPEIQRSRNPEIQKSRNSEIQKSRDLAIQKSSRRRNQPQGPP